MTENLTFLMFWGSASLQLPNGVTYHTGTYQDRLGKLQEHLRQLSILFRKLRLVYDKCNENCAGLDPVPIEVSIFIHTEIIDQDNHSPLSCSRRLMQVFNMTEIIQCAFGPG